MRLGMQIAFGRVRRKTAPTGLGIATLIFSKIDTYGSVRNADRIWVSTLQNRTYRAWW